MISGMLQMCRTGPSSSLRSFVLVVLPSCNGGDPTVRRIFQQHSGSITLLHLTNADPSIAMARKVVQTSRTEDKEGDKSIQNSSAGLVIDPDEVMRAMMAARKGKARDMSDSEEDGSAADSLDDSDVEDEESFPHTSGDDEVGSSSESSARGKEISRRRSRSRSIATPATAETARISQDDTTSRVKRSTNPGITRLGGRINPFDGPKAASHATFAALGLSEPLINALAGINITRPTEIQSACVAPILDGEYPRSGL